MRLISITASIVYSFLKLHLMYADIHTALIWLKSGMNPKVLQYLMGHSDISVTLNTYTHLKLDDAREEVEKLAKKKAEAENEFRHLGMKENMVKFKKMGVNGLI